MFNSYLANTAIADVGFFNGLITLTELNWTELTGYSFKTSDHLSIYKYNKKLLYLKQQKLTNGE